MSLYTFSIFLILNALDTNPQHNNTTDKQNTFLLFIELTPNNTKIIKNGKTAIEYLNVL
ncbi:hypothetical protein FACS189493_0070 [Spirochaetia bacterium]|nr:hypothetical protein FACS189493_0070 [Spirochaetia bacterium]